MSSRQIVLDTETTGLETSEGHRVIEIGCVELVDRKYTHNNFHYYLLACHFGTDSLFWTQIAHGARSFTPDGLGRSTGTARR